MPMGPIHTVTAWRATGRLRVRSGWLGWAVLEVEEAREHWAVSGPAQRRKTGDETRWRRARSRDFTCNVEVVLR